MKKPMTQTVVATGVVPQANMKISAVDGGAEPSGGAFVDFTAANVLTTHIGHLLKIYDSSKRVIQGYIKAAGSGEGVGADVGSVFTDWTGAAPTGWTQLGTPDASNYTEENPADQFHIVSNGVQIGITKISVLTINRLYRNTIDISAVVNGITMGGNVANDKVTYTATGNAQVKYFTTTTNTASLNRVPGGCSATLDNWKLEPILTPSATGVTVTSAKGGATYNWAAKQTSFNYNDAAGYTYEIIKIADLKEVTDFGGAATAASAHVSTVAGNAFFFYDGWDFAPYQDGRHYLRLKDAAGVVAWSKIKAAVPGGETLSATEQILYGNFSFSTGWDLTNGAAIAGGVLTFPVNAVAIHRASRLAVETAVAKALYKFSHTVISNDAAGITSYVLKGDATNKYNLTDIELLTTVGTNSIYFSGNSVGTGQYAFSQLTGAITSGSLVVDNYTLKRVTIPPATGVILVNNAAAETMIACPTAFNPNTIADVRVYYQGD